MQHFQELMSSVEVNKGLLANRKKDAEIKLEEMRSHMDARRAAAENLFEEIVERTIILKNQFLESVETKGEAASLELRNSTEVFDEKMEYLDAVLEQIRLIEEVRVVLHKSDTCDEDLVGFFFANQEKIRGFIQEDNEQKMMVKLRNSFDTIDNKHRQFMEAELRRNQEVLHATIQTVFNPGEQPKSMKDKSRLIDVETEPKLKPLSKYILPDSYGLSANRPSEEARNKRNPSNSNINIGLSASRLPIMNINQPEYGARDLQSTPLLSAVLTSALPPRSTPIRPASNTSVYHALDQFHNQMTSKSDKRHTQTIHSTKQCPHEKELDPMLSIQRKLAQFDIHDHVRERVPPQAHHNHLAKPKDWVHPHYSKDLQKESRDEVLATLIDPKTANVENLRNFRQKMREKYNKDSIAATAVGTGGSSSLRNRMAYNTH